MSDIDTPQEMFETNCSTNSEPFALQNLGSYMEPEFSENCIVIIDPGMQIHNRAYAIVRYDNDMYFRQYLVRGNKKFNMMKLNLLVSLKSWVVWYNKNNANKSRYITIILIEPRVRWISPSVVKLKIKKNKRE